METTIRPARATDAAECGRIIYAAFTNPDFSYRVGFRAAMMCATAEPVKRMAVVG